MSERFYWNEFVADINNTLRDGDTVLDAGAGDGEWQHKIVADVKYISMDLGVGDPSLDYSHLDITGDLRNIPIDANTVDAIICIQVLEHVTEPWVVLDEFYRVLKPSGTLFLTCPQGVPLHQEPYDFYRYTHHGLTFLATRSGFATVWIKPQQGDITKIANDMKILSNQMGAEGARFRALLMRAVGAAFRVLFKRLDGQYALNTTGYFVKASKPNG